MQSRLEWYAAVARWAPSKHNSQPWCFAVRGSSLEVWTDERRALPVTDPEHRELVLALGGAVQCAVVAARALGRSVVVTVHAERAEGLLATLHESSDWEPTVLDEALLEAVLTRRTDRGPLDGEHLRTSLGLVLQAVALTEGAGLRFVSSPEDRGVLASLVAQGDRLMARQEGVDAEIAAWLRPLDDVRPDGVPVDHTRGAHSSYRAEFVQRDFGAQGVEPAQDRQDPDHPLVGVLCTTSDTVADWLAAGRAMMAVLLRADVADVHASFLNQPLEDPGLRAELTRALALPGMPQLVLRLGRGGPVLPTPRRPASSLVHAIVTRST